MTPSGWRDGAERLRASEGDRSDGPELNSCESERACRHIWVSAGTGQIQRASHGEHG